MLETLKNFWELLKGDKKFLALVSGGFAVILVLFLLLLFPGSRQLGNTLGEDRIGGILLAIPLGEDSTQASASAAGGRYLFWLVHFYLDNPSMVGISQLPASLALRNVGEGWESLGELYRANPQQTVEILREEFGIRSYYYHTLEMANLQALVDGLGGISVFNRHHGSFPGGHFVLVGAALPRYLQVAVATPPRQAVAAGHFMYQFNRMSDIMASIIARLARQKDSGELFWKPREQWDSFLHHVWVNDKASNFSVENLSELLAFWDEPKDLHLVPFRLPMYHQTKGGGLFFVREGKTKTKLWQKYSKQLAKDYVWYSDPSLKLHGFRNQDFVAHQKEKMGIEVLNATGIYRQAKLVRNKLARKGFKVLQFGNYSGEPVEQNTLLVRNLIDIHPKNLQDVEQVIGNDYRIRYYTDLSMPIHVTIILADKVQDK